MKESIPDQIISQIFKLKLQTRLIADSKVAFPISIKGKLGKESYRVRIEAGTKKLASYNQLFIELKGNIDIEYLKYGGEVQITPIIEEPGYYRMKIINFYKLNERQYKRVPYRRAIKITEPIECEGILVNISASGAMIQTKERIDTQDFMIEFVLLRKEMILNAQIVEQKYNEEQGLYFIRCYFNNISHKDKRIIMQAVKEITLMAKRRLQG